MENPQGLSQEEIQQSFEANADDFAEGLITGKQYLSVLRTLFGERRATEIFNTQLNAGGHPYENFKPGKNVSIPHLGPRGFGIIDCVFGGQFGGAVVKIGTVKLPFGFLELMPANEPGSEHGSGRRGENLCCDTQGQE